jgi:hypothetical protein
MIDKSATLRMFSGLRSEVKSPTSRSDVRFITLVIYGAITDTDKVNT